MTECHAGSQSAPLRRERSTDVLQKSPLRRGLGLAKPDLVEAAELVERCLDREIGGLTRDELAKGVVAYELREARIVELFEAHPVTEYALQRALESDWRVDCFEIRIAVLQNLIERHFDLESELMHQVQASAQQRDLRLIGSRAQSLRSLCAARRGNGGEQRNSLPAAAE